MWPFYAPGLSNLTPILRLLSRKEFLAAREVNLAKRFQNTIGLNEAEVIQFRHHRNVKPLIIYGDFATKLPHKAGLTILVQFTAPV